MLIGVDLDDVLVDTCSAIIRFHNDTYGTNLTKDKFYSWRLGDLWGVTNEEANKRVREFYNSPYFKNMEPVVGSIDAVTTLKQSNELIVVTSRLNQSVELTKGWMDFYFRNKFQGIYFAKNFYAQDKKDKSKSEICLDLGVEFLIEDSLDYAVQCAEKGIEVLLYDAPWNQYEKLPERIRRVNNWKEIVDIINHNKA